MEAVFQRGRRHLAHPFLLWRQRSNRRTFRFSFAFCEARLIPISSDTHDVISVRVFEQEYARVEKPFEVNRDTMDPYAQK